MNSNRQSRRRPPFRSRPAGEEKAGADRHDAAVEVAIAALGFIANCSNELSRFLALTGIDPGSIRTASEQPGFLGGVLGYIAGSERTLLAFAASAGLAPEEIERAKQDLAGTSWERDLP